MSSYINELSNFVGNKPLILCGATVVVVDGKGRVLMQKRADDGMWGFPGGSSELGESLEETGIREVFEETGIHVKGLTLFDVFSGKNQHHIYPNGDEVYNVSVVYVCKDYDGTPRPDNVETTDVRFFKMSELPDDISKPIIPILEQYMRH